MTTTTTMMTRMTTPQDDDDDDDHKTDHHPQHLAEWLGGGEGSEVGSKVKGQKMHAHAQDEEELGKGENRAV